MSRFVTLFIVIMLLATGVVNASIKVTEIAWMGTTESQFGEWIELYNDGEDDVDLSGWKIYEAGGEQLIFSLTKNISAKGYLLIERITASSPDPVPNIDDESGTFGGSGLSNSGEYLVLKNSNGEIEQSLDFSSGWPAGDTETKNTMSWDGSNWVTATPTPKAPNSNEQNDDVPNDVIRKTSSAFTSPKSEPKIELSLPKKIYTNVRYEYNAKTYLEYGDAYSGVFLWNMGDGTIYKSTSPKPINHTFKYPGTYNIAFAYYKNPYDKKPYLSSFVEKNVIDSQIDLKIIENKGLQFTNSDTVAMDISGWYVVFFDQILELPQLTIIPSKKSVIMPFSSFGLSSKYKEATLQTPDRITIKTTLQTNVLSSKSSIANYDTVKLQKTDNLNKISLQDDNNTVEDLPKESENKQGKNVNMRKFIFAGVLLFVVILFVLIERHRLLIDQP